jgi:hypothetical protein
MILGRVFFCSSGSDAGLRTQADGVQDPGTLVRLRRRLSRTVQILNQVPVSQSTQRFATKDNGNEQNMLLKREVVKKRRSFWNQSVWICVHVFSLFFVTRM